MVSLRPHKHRARVEPFRAKRGRRISQTKTVPAPIGGWNARDGIGLMPPQDATSLIDWWPIERNVIARKGYELHCNIGVAAPVRTVVPYETPTSSKVLATCDGKIYDVTTSTAVELKDSLASEDFSTLLMGGRLIFVNGADDPFYYNGSATASAGLSGTGLTVSKLIHGIAFKSRMYFVEDDSQNFWYGGVSAVTGALEKFDLSLVGSFKGKLLALTSIVNDGGDGKDDLFVCIFSEGDVVVYQGSDPGGVDWNHVGTYAIGAPVSRHAIHRNGNEIVIITDRGYELLQRSLVKGQAIQSKDLLSDKIKGAVDARITQTPRSDDWRIMQYNQAKMMLVQAPINATKADYHVRNINTGAWTRFRLPKALSWCVNGGDAYMGSRDGKVHRFWVGGTDDGQAIALEGETAWNYLGDTGGNKSLNMLKFNMSSVFYPIIYVTVNVDFKKSTRSTYIEQPTQSTPAYWDDATWNAAYWSYNDRTRDLWHDHVADGTCFSVKVRTLNATYGLAWNSIMYVYEKGGLL